MTYLDTLHALAILGYKWLWSSPEEPSSGGLSTTGSFELSDSAGASRSYNAKVGEYSISGAPSTSSLILSIVACQRRGYCAPKESIQSAHTVATWLYRFAQGFSVNRSLIWWCSIWFLLSIVIGSCWTTVRVIKIVLTSWIAASLLSKGVSTQEFTHSFANIRKFTNPLKVNGV